MGCSQPSHGGALPPPSEIPEVDLSKLDSYSKFEYQFPFYRTRVDIFEGRVKRFVFGKKSVSFAQLKYAFKDDKKWADLQDENSLLVEILKSEFFEDEDTTGELSLQSLLLWGVLLCAGDARLKARVFYDILQDSLQDSISASDKDFPESFSKLIGLATKLVYRYEDEYGESRRESKLDSEQAVTDDLLDQIKEDFLDNVYGAQAKLYREEYLAILSTKENWIFNPDQIRQKVRQHIKGK